MQLAQVRYKGRKRVGVVAGQEIQLLPRRKQGGMSLADILHSKNPTRTVHKLLSKSKTVDLNRIEFLPPIHQQEVWAAGVTYQRSESARKEESQGAAPFYHAVYQAPRPELFFKATPHRVAGHMQPIRIRTDSDWNVPEPELTLVLSPALAIVGYTIGNDVSSRSIEGENPLYLPQAKCYQSSCSLGPWITLADEAIHPEELGIRLQIIRDGVSVYDGHTSTKLMARKFADLVSWLGRNNSFPHGCFLMTGTGIVPDNGFTLQQHDVVEIEIENLGKLVNYVG